MPRRRPTRFHTLPAVPSFRVLGPIIRLQLHSSVNCAVKNPKIFRNGLRNFEI